MSYFIVLDSGVLGIVSHPDPSDDSIACTKWMLGHILQGNPIVIPEIVDYEIRREYTRRNNQRALRKLDSLYNYTEYLPIITEATRKAGELWAWARNSGHITAPMHDLNADVILAAQVSVAVTEAEAKIIATTNVRHLAPFADARLWRDIP